MRVAIHTQHFAGVGHQVRASRLARAFRQAGGRVLVFDGGRPFKESDAAPGEAVDCVHLPPVVWGRQGLKPWSGSHSLPAVLADRRRLLLEGLSHLRPDLFLIDSFPFSRWALRAEILAGIHRLKADNSSARVVCSLRDVPRVSRHHRNGALREGVPVIAHAWPERPGDDGLDAVPELLNAHFDAIVIHGDPRVALLEAQYPWWERLQIPVHYTGFVRQEEPGSGPASVLLAARPLIVVSVGGGVNGLALIDLVTAAWGLLRRSQGWAGGTMLVFGGALMSPAELARAGAACQRHGAQFERFSQQFPAWLRAADLSISRGGYNTMVALLAAGVRGLVFPAADVSDQSPRVRRLAAMGVVSTGDEARLVPSLLADQMIAVLSQSPPVHDLALDGAENTVALLTALVNNPRRSHCVSGLGPGGTSHEPLEA